MIVTPDEFRRIAAQAKREYPNECCGVILVKDGPPEERVLRECRNVQDEWHRREPDRYPRTARTAYNIGPDDLMAIDRLVAKGYRPIIYHSHIDAAAYFSPTDRDRALWQGRPLYPEATYLVLSVMQGEVVAAAAFRWDPGEEDFVSLELEGFPP